MSSAFIHILKHPATYYNNQPTYILCVCAEIHRCNLSIVLMGPQQCPALSSLRGTTQIRAVVRAGATGA